MAARILIIDNEECTLQLFMQVAGALNIEYQILYNWGRTTSIINKNEIKAIFVNVELNFIDLQLMMKHFEEQNPENRIPVFFLFSKSFNKNYLAARRYPHAGELKKPLKAQEIFEALNTCFDLEKHIEYPEENYRKKLQMFKAYYATTTELINKLEAYFE